MDKYILCLLKKHKVARNDDKTVVFLNAEEEEEERYNSNTIRKMVTRYVDIQKELKKSFCA